MELSGHEWQRAEEVLGQGCQRGTEGGARQGVARTLLCRLTALMGSHTPAGVGDQGISLGSGGREGSSQSAWGGKDRSFPSGQPG